MDTGMVKAPSIDRRLSSVKTHTASDLAEQVAERTGLSLQDSKQAVDMTFKLIKEGYFNKERYVIRGLCTFELKKRGARTGRDFKHKKPIKIAECHTPTVNMSDALVRSVHKKTTLG